MPRLSKSPEAKKRTKNLLDSLIDYASNPLMYDKYFNDKIAVRWIATNKESPQVIIQTELKYLAQLLHGVTQNSKQDTEYIRHDLRLLKDFVGILQDNRVKTQGSAKWHFTLNLWHRHREENLREFDNLWQHLTG